jgi:2-polyprenyl-3-methyl-5-hydroxy-6-metoxy-1,4-benzoquinol methylase
MENPSPPAMTHEQARASVPALFSSQMLRQYAAGKLRADPVFRAAYELLGTSNEPILDVGCGVGLLPFYLRHRGFRPATTGLDVDRGKIQRARAAAKSTAGSTHFLEQDVACALPAFRGNVALLDVLHYLPPAAQETLLTELAARVAPGGMLLARECPRDRSARFWATYAGELFAQSISWNLRRRLHFPTRNSINAAFCETEFTREERPMFAGGPFNNRLFIFRRKR